MTPGNSIHTRKASSDAFDELAALFLTESDGGPAPERAAPLRQPSFRELLIVGNLPVRGGVWLTPYADAIAREHGPAALLRLDLTPPTLELLRTPARSSGASGGSREQANDPPRLKDAIAEAARDVAVWIVRGPQHSAAGAAADYARSDVDRITILTSADSAAVVAAHQIVKEIIHSAATSGDSSVDLPPIALAVVGSERETAEEIVSRMNATLSHTFGIEVSLATCLPRMDAGVRCTAFAGFFEEETPAVREVLEWIDLAEGVEAWDQAGMAEEAQPRLRLAPVHEEVNVERERLLDEADAGARDESDEVAPPEIETFVNGHAGAAVERTPAKRETGEVAPVARAVEPQPAGRVRIAPKPSVATARPAAIAPAVEEPKISLASFIGVSALPLRCPNHPHIELATDTEGNVHILGRESSLRDLRIVENWTRAHRNLLAMACPDRAIHADGQVICHVFTDEPATLADLHGTGLRLHVLAPVIVEGRTTWYSAPLSR